MTDMWHIAFLIAAVVTVSGCGKSEMENIKLTSRATQLADSTSLMALLGASLTTASDHKPASVLCYQLPELWLPSGQVVASDGFIMDQSPFSRKVQPGEYPVVLVIARLGEDERVALAILRFSEAPVAKWEMAVTKGQDIKTLGKDEIFGYGVDSGTGCFCDPAAQKRINAVSDSQMEFFDRVNSEMQKAYRNTRDWVHIETADGSAALFSSGFGDGFYPSYFGLDEAGEATALVTDFGIVDWPRRP
jgi:hypothetical protein